MVLSLLLALLPLAARSSAVHDPALQFISTLLGEDHVLSVFRSPEFLHSSMALENERHEATTLSQPQSTRHRVACFKYDKGQAFADASRKMYKQQPDVTAALPFLVDIESNLMCFTVKSSTVAKKQLEMEALIDEHEAIWDHPIPAALKIHHSIYDAVDTLADQLPYVSNATFLTVYIRNITIGHAGKSSDGLPSAVEEKIAALTSYDLSCVEDFFWTSPRSLALLTTARPMEVSSLEVQGDTSRMRKWYELAQTLQYEPVNSDACGFASIPTQLFDTKVSFDVSSFLSDGESSLGGTVAAACMIYLTALFAEDPSVTQISMTAAPNLLNVKVHSIIQAGVVDVTGGSAIFSKAGLLGDGQIVSVADTGVDETSCFFIDSKGAVPRGTRSQPIFDSSYRKIVSYTAGFSGVDNTDELEGHGTHVAGTIAGNIVSSTTNALNLYGGVAPNAKLIVADLANPGNGLRVCGATCLYSFPFSRGAFIHTNSWGSPFAGAGYYTGSDVDLFLFNRPSFMIFFAAGNSGTNGPGSVTMESSAKNVVSVGATETGPQDMGNLGWFSSIGPAYDGRIKPDILAPGDSVVSASSNYLRGPSCATVVKSGTSMASPSAAGAAALVRQYFIDRTFRYWSAICNGKYGFCKSFSPSGVLTKAVLLHSGTAIQNYWIGDNLLPYTNAPPDNYQGYGLINLSKVLPLVTTSFDLFVDDLRSIKQNSIVSYTVSVTSSSKPLKVTVSWYDYPAPDGSKTAALINDLDLEVTSINANARLHGNLGSSSTFDRLNNNEQVFVANPTLGDWQVVVSANALPYSGTQLFSIVITCAGSVNAHSI